MKLKIIFIALISIAIESSYPPSNQSNKTVRFFRLPSYKDMLAILNSNNNGQIFPSREVINLIANTFSNQRFSRDELVRYLSSYASNEDMPTINDAADFIIRIVQNNTFEEHIVDPSMSDWIAINHELTEK